MKIFIKASKEEFNKKKLKLVEAILGKHYSIKERINVNQTKEEILIEKPIKELYNDFLKQFNNTLNIIDKEIKKELKK